MPEMTEKGGRGKIIFLFIALILLILLFIGFFINPKSIMKLLIWLLAIAFFLIIIFLVMYIFWYIFIRKQKYDITYVNKQKLIQAGYKSCPMNIYKRRLILSGDRGHSRVNWGTILGYCRIQVLTRQLSFDDDGNPTTQKNTRTGELEPVYIIGKEEQDVFITKTRGGILGLFEEPGVVRVSPHDHDELIGDITLYGFSLLPISEYYFLNTDLLDVRKIDYSILKEAQRGIMFEHLRDMKSIVDKATGLDSPHIKDLEKKNLYDIPGLTGQQP